MFRDLDFDVQITKKDPNKLICFCAYCLCVCLLMRERSSGVLNYYRSQVVRLPFSSII